MKVFPKFGTRPAFLAAATAVLMLATSAAPVVSGQVTGERLEVAASSIKVRGVKLFGNSRYICTPSGFGQKARCYLRSRVG